MVNEFDETNLTKPKNLPTFLNKEEDLDVFITQFEEGNKSDRINRWLFHSLRVSPLDIDLLARMILDIVMIDTDNPDMEDVSVCQRSVALAWFIDKANFPADQFLQPRTQTYLTQGDYLHQLPAGPVALTV